MEGKESPVGHRPAALGVNCTACNLAPGCQNRPGMSPSSIADDLSVDFNAVSGRIVHPSGVRYHVFRKSLRPVYWKIWVAIALGYAGELAIGIALVTLPFPG